MPDGAQGFRFTSAALRITVEEDLRGTSSHSSSAAVSAVYVTSNDHFDPGIIFTLSSALASKEVLSDSRCSFSFAAKESVGEVDVVTTFKLPALFDIVQKLKSSNAMRFHPPCSSDSSAFLCLFRPRTRCAVSRRFFYTGRFNVGSSIIVEGAPFVLDGPALFLGYQTVGTVSLVTGKDGGIIFSDVRYMDGMEGSAVLGEDGSSVGVLAGTLRKTTGEGELSVICSWSSIVADISNQIQSRDASELFDLIGLKDASATSAKAEAAGTEMRGKETGNLYRSVVGIFVRHGNGQGSWGSGIILSNDTIVTNRHVVPAGRLNTVILFSDTDVTRRIKSILNPIPDLDIVYLILDEPHDSLPVRLSAGNLAQMSPVTTVGYGLFSPLASESGLCLKPLACNGFVSQVVRLPLEATDSTPDAAMLSVSASCWNGSSGGAVFTQVQGHGVLVGMITSNGIVEETGKIYPQLGFVIPSSVIGLGWQAARRGKTVRIHDRVKKLWKMHSTHKDILDSSENKSLL